MFFPTISELKDRYKNDIGRDFESDSALFEHTFLHGAFHEEAIDWLAIADRLTDEDAAQLVTSAIRCLIASTGDYRGEEGIGPLMRLYTAAGEHLKKRLDDVARLTTAIREVRALFETQMKQELLAWHIESYRGLMLYEIRLARRLGLKAYDIERHYTQHVEDAVDFAGRNR